MTITTNDASVAKTKKVKAKTKPREVNLAALGDRLLTINECAEKIGVSRVTIYNWQKSGRLPKFKRLGPGPRARVGLMMSQIDTFLENPNQSAVA